jgi:enolase
VRKREVLGTIIEVDYHSDEVTAVREKAARTILGQEGGYSTKEEAAQDVLNALVTAMQLGAFRDFEPKGGAVADFPLWGA